MRRIMHQYGETQLPRPDNHYGEDKGQRIGEQIKQRHRPENHAPCMGNQAQPDQIGTALKFFQNLRRDQFAGPQA